MVKVGVWRDWSCQCFSLSVTLIRSLLSQWGSRKPYQPLFGFMTENSRVGTHSEIFIFLFILFHLSQISFTRSTITVCVTSWLSCGEHTTYTVRHAAGQLYHLTLAAMNVIVVWWEKPVLYPFVEACFSAGCWFSASFGSVTSYSTASKPSTLPGRKTWEIKNNPTSQASVLVLCVGVHAFIWQKCWLKLKLPLVVRYKTEDIMFAHHRKQVSVLSTFQPIRFGYLLGIYGLLVLL